MIIYLQFAEHEKERARTLSLLEQEQQQLHSLIGDRDEARQQRDQIQQTLDTVREELHKVREHYFCTTQIKFYAYIILSLIAGVISCDIFIALVSCIQVILMTTVIKNKNMFIFICSCRYIVL